MTRQADESFTEAKERRKRGQKGKKAEALVETELVAFRNDSSNLDFDRLPDSRAAGRPMPPRVSDFGILYFGKTTSLEVKEVKKGNRINLKSTFPQYPRMLRRNMAGASGYVLVRSIEKGLWYLIDIRDIPKKVKSFSFTAMAEEGKAGVAKAPGSLIKEAIGWL